MRRRSKHHSFEEVSAVLRLDSETGQLWWKKKTGPRCDVTKPAGTLDKTTGYIVVQVLRRPYKAHRLVWLSQLQGRTLGTFPTKELARQARERAYDAR